MDIDCRCFHVGADGIECACSAGDTGSGRSGSGTSPGGGLVNPLQYSCLENPMDRGAWWVVVHGVHGESDTTDRLTLTDSLKNILVLSFRSKRCIFRNSEVWSL